MAVTWMVIAFVFMLLFTAPVAFAIGVAATLGIFIADTAPILIVPQRIVAGADSFVLLAIPLFILAGALMETGGISARLVELARVLVGHIRGGLGMAVVVAEIFFSGISGSTVADVSAIGSLMIPSLVHWIQGRSCRRNRRRRVRDGHSRATLPHHGCHCPNRRDISWSTVSCRISTCSRPRTCADGPDLFSGASRRNRR